MKLDFYTIKSENEIEAGQLSAIVQAMMIYVQPDIVGDIFEEDGTYLLRFAVRYFSIRPYEDEFKSRIEEIIGHPIELTLAARI